MRHIVIGGKSRPVHYSINALIEFEDATGIEIKSGVNIDQLGKLKNIRSLAFIGLKHGAQNTNAEVDFDEDQVGNWISFTDGTADKFMDAFSKDQGGENAAPVEEAGDEKKN